MALVASVPFIPFGITNANGINEWEADNKL